ncbi:hypothetical protein F5887DRAFT_272312 [Amanita rubescens]|nr:hypothetical protein F5887DRAFT_272312 [Amanita rubescens]
MQLITYLMRFFSIVFGVPAPYQTNTARLGTMHAPGPWNYQMASCPGQLLVPPLIFSRLTIAIAPFPGQAMFRPMDIEIPTAVPFTVAPPCDPADWWEPLQNPLRNADHMPPLSSPSMSSLSDFETPPPPPHTSPVVLDSTAIAEPSPSAGRTAVMIRKRQGSYLKPRIGEETQSEYCQWEHCGELIACDRSSVNDHMRQHIRDLYVQGLLFTSIDGRPFKGPAKSRLISKCQTHCRWRDDIPCPYSDVYESKTHEAMLRKKRRKMQKRFGRGVKRSDWGRNIHVRHSDTPSEESDSEIEAKAGRSRGVQPNGSLISVQSLIKHICGTHLLSLMMTCEDCDERFSRTDAYGRHRKEVHDGEPRGKNH